MNKQIPIKIQEDFVEGTECLQNEVPWQVPGSIYKEDELLDSEDIVLELGTGGSTLFFARRCKIVTAIETSAEWYATVADRIKELGIENVIYEFIPDEDSIYLKLLENNFADVTVVSVDTQGGYNRSMLLGLILSKNMPKLRMIVLDNYGHEGLFPKHWDRDWSDAWEVFDYNHERWAGNGTRILMKKK